MANPSSDLIDFSLWTNVDAHLHVKFSTKEGALEFMARWGQTLIEMEDEGTIVVDTRIGLADPMKYYEKDVDNTSEE